MRERGEARPLAQTLGSAVIGVGLGLGILALGFVVSRTVLPDNVVVASIAPSPSAARTAPTAVPVVVTPTPTTAPARTAAPTPEPTQTPDPMVVTSFQGQGLRLAAIALPAGYTMSSPIAGTIRIELYQYAGGEIKTGLTDQPTYPYVFVRSAEREIKLRPGVVGRDVQLLVKDGDTVQAGAPLFKTLTGGTSSWQTFYDRGVTAQVVASAVDLTTNQAIDPVPIFKR